MKRFLVKSFLTLMVIGATGFLVGQLYPEAYKGFFNNKELTHSRTTTIQVYTGKRRGTGLSISVNPYDHKQFLNTQISMMLSEQFLIKMINDYQLTELWEIDKAELLASIKLQLKFRTNNADYIEIETFANNDEQAQQLAYAVTMSYNARRIADLEARRKEVIKLFEEKIKYVEVQALKKRKVYKAISKKLGIPYDTEKKLNPLPANFEKLVPSVKDRLDFTNAKDEYEREFRILQSIKQAELSEVILADLEIAPFIIHKCGWTTEVAAMMNARKK